MPLDNEPRLKAAFVELHRRERADAPPFESVSLQAMKATNGQPSLRRNFAGRILLWGAPAMASAAAVLLWISGRLSAPAPVTSPASTPEVASSGQVEQLLNSIEWHLEKGEAGNSPVYATDALLTQLDTNLTP
jgi:hypothetical protein